MDLHVVLDSYAVPTLLCKIKSPVVCCKSYIVLLALPVNSVRTDCQCAMQKLKSHSEQCQQLHLRHRAYSRWVAGSVEALSAALSATLTASFGLDTVSQSCARAVRASL